MTEYKSLDEHMEGRQPGEIRVTHRGWPAEAWFQPYYVNGNSWYGPSKYNRMYGVLRHLQEWRIWQEPKKVKMHKHWQVSVDADGENLLTIESSMLSNKVLSEEHLDIIRGAAYQLFGFAGKRETDE